MWQPDGHTLEQMETEVNKDDASKSVYLEYTLDFQTALIFVPIAAADVPHEREPAVILRRLQGKRARNRPLRRNESHLPSWGGEPQRPSRHLISEPCLALVDSRHGGMMWTCVKEISR